MLPRGIGGLLIHRVGREWHILEAFEAPVQANQAKALEIPFQQAAGQAVLEGLAVLRALQLWSTKIQGGPVVIRSDSSVALSMSKKMSSPTKTLNYLAAKIALLLEHATITKLVPQHVPGKLNTEADWLSRLGDRGQMPPYTGRRQDTSHYGAIRAHAWRWHRRGWKEAPGPSRCLTQTECTTACERLLVKSKPGKCTLGGRFVFFKTNLADLWCDHSQACTYTNRNSHHQPQPFRVKSWSWCAWIKRQLCHPVTWWPGPLSLEPGGMAAVPTGVPGRNVISVMCAAALPVQHQSGRQAPERGYDMLAMVRGHHSQGTKSPETDQRSEPKNNASAKRWNVGAWDAYEYRANVPKLSQHDRDKSTRRSTQLGLKRGDAELINMGPTLQHKEGKLRRGATTPQSRAKRMATVMGAMIAAASPRK